MTKDDNLSSYKYFTHEIDEKTSFCQKCGKFLGEIQKNRQWGKKVVKPVCIPAGNSNVVAISHLVRRG